MGGGQEGDVNSCVRFGTEHAQQQFPTPNQLAGSGRLPVGALLKVKTLTLIGTFYLSLVFGDDVSSTALEVQQAERVVVGRDGTKQGGARETNGTWVYGDGAQTGDLCPK